MTFLSDVTEVSVAEVWRAVGGVELQAVGGADGVSWKDRQTEPGGQVYERDSENRAESQH